MKNNIIYIIKYSIDTANKNLKYLKYILKAGYKIIYSTIQSWLRRKITKKMPWEGDSEL
jgi:hypothetical protein